MNETPNETQGQMTLEEAVRTLQQHYVTTNYPNVNTLNTVAVAEWKLQAAVWNALTRRMKALDGSGDAEQQIRHYQGKVCIGRMESILSTLAAQRERIATLEADKQTLLDVRAENRAEIARLRAAGSVGMTRDRILPLVEKWWSTNKSGKTWVDGFTDAILSAFPPAPALAPAPDDPRVKDAFFCQHCGDPIDYNVLHCAKCSPGPDALATAEARLKARLRSLENGGPLNPTDAEEGEAK